MKFLIPAYILPFHSLFIYKKKLCYEKNNKKICGEESKIFGKPAVSSPGKMH